MQWSISVALGVVLACTVPASGQTDYGGRPPACAFAIAPGRVSPEIIAATPVKERALVMAQPDSPLAIVRLDLSGVALRVAGGWFNTRGRHAIDVKNVSDQTITDARVMVRVGTGPASGTGTGFKMDGPLHPGEETRIEWASGPGSGASGTDALVSVVALVELVRTAACTYKPSQAWPAPGDSGPSELPAPR